MAVKFQFILLNGRVKCSFSVRAPKSLLTFFSIFSSLTLTSSSSLNNLSPIQVQMQEEALVMERRRSETLKVDKMRIEHCLEQVLQSLTHF